MNHIKGIEHTLSSFYAILSGERTQPRAWDDMRALFYPGACLFPNSVTNTASGSPGVDVDTYIAILDRFLGQNDFFETGTITKVVMERGIASVTGLYEARHRSCDPAPFKTGTIFIHLLQSAGSWRITSMIWRDE